ncbi:hypothetical protein IEO21_07069 [Rhodonia placenta]|uniref:Uncharacterized protein n=2 Tax=Rhodonia placenta TaxID=104341 RepID=A0A1X6MK32_9APHY|nr:hypothetical protein POSPLADRAFT_1041845 [Postia placenta MAD-698-R-SB12]KAF9810227.1 hypothetical protein IEO21_07069 [Postia placenta]OSX56744.1 hypothetical protein POSPLADRAFT_1041845 [Postia placenta MAD-698-R-SB12]
MRFATILSLLAVLAIGVSASPAPIRPAGRDVDAAASPQRPHVYSRRPRAHP